MGVGVGRRVGVGVGVGRRVGVGVRGAHQPLSGAGMLHVLLMTHGGIGVHDGVGRRVGVDVGERVMDICIDGTGRDPVRRI